MTIGRILKDDLDRGSGFALATPDSRTTRVVLTAKHIVGNQEVSSLQFVTQAGRKIPVERVEGDDDLDIAVLHLSEDVAEGLAVGRAVEGESWQVKTQPRGNDPILTGTISATRLRLVRQSGHEIYALQLQVDPILDDYRGYSGSPVVLKSPTDAVIGVLIERQLSRLSVPIGQPRPATNVLYALPIQDVLDRFGLTAVSAALVSGSTSPILDPSSSVASTSSPDPSLPASSTLPSDPNVSPLAQAIITQGQVESNAVEQKATSDIPIQTIDKDKLGFAIYVRAFRDFIASQDTSTPLTIGIYGTWGSGKSSLMHMIKNELDPPLDSLSKRWLRHLWWQWFRSYLGTLCPWLFAKLQLWRDDKRGRAQKFKNTYANQPNTASNQSSAASNQGNQPNNNAYNVGTDTANATAIQNSTDSNQSDQANNVSTNNVDPAQNGPSSASNTSASMNNGHGGSTQHSHDDSRTLDKIGGPRRFQKIREDLSYTPSMPQKIEDATELQKMRAGLSYDPSTTDKRLEDLTDSDERHWAKFAAAHCPIVPLTHPTIWFNAWKFDQEEQLWAALALEVMNQIKQKYGYVGRILFWARLTWKRSSHLAAFWSIIWRFVLPIVLLFIAVTYTLYITSITNVTAFQHIYDYLGPFSLKGPYAAFMPLILLAGAILSGIPAVKIIKDPFQIPVKDILDKPNYQDKVGFIGNFEKDFARIVSVATRRHLGWKPQKLVIFIDDLDRCEPPKAADIIESINLFLDSDRCVFVLGMDPNAVAASIENYNGPRN